MTALSGDGRFHFGEVGADAGYRVRRLKHQSRRNRPAFPLAGPADAGDGERRPFGQAVAEPDVVAAVRPGGREKHDAAGGADIDLEALHIDAVAERDPASGAVAEVNPAPRGPHAVRGVAAFGDHSVGHVGVVAVEDDEARGEQGDVLPRVREQFSQVVFARRRV